MTSNDVDVIVLNYNGLRYLGPLLASLKTQSIHVQVTLVDNGSSDGSVEWVRQHYPDTSVLPFKRNLGFAVANNIAVSRTRGRLVFFLNNDTVIEADCAERLVKACERYPDAAAVGAKMLLHHPAGVIDSVGTVMMPDGAPFNRGIGQIDIGQYDRQEEVFGACFGAVMIPREKWNRVGPLDPSYFAYFEDVDWCYRARLAGFSCWVEPAAVVHHHHSGTSKSFSYEWKYRLIHRNFLRTVIKNVETRRLAHIAMRKLLALFRGAFAPPGSGHGLARRLSCMRVLGRVFIDIPNLLVKRHTIQRSRFAGATDEAILNFCHGEEPFFDPESYSPIYTLDMLHRMYARKAALNGDADLSCLVDRIQAVNDAKNCGIPLGWDDQVRQLLDELAADIGADHADRFYRAMVIDKIWCH